MAQAQEIPFMMDPVYSDDEEREPDSSDSSDHEEDEENDDEARIGHTEWCECGTCAAMATAAESFCCCEHITVKEKMRDIGQNDTDCITQTERFQVLCLDPDVIHLLLMTIHNVLSRGPLQNPVPNRYVVRIIQRMHESFQNDVCSLQIFEVGRVQAVYALDLWATWQRKEETHPSLCDSHQQKFPVRGWAI
mgnify:CR=1 FL=1